MKKIDFSDDDWRLHATAHLADDWVNPWSGGTVTKGTRLTVVSVIQLTKNKQLTIPLPNATAILLNAPAISFHTANSIREKSGIDKSIRSQVEFESEKDVFDYIERMVESVILAFTALEAFINESIPEDFIYSRHCKNQSASEAVDKPTIERHVPIDEKLTFVLPEVFKCSSPKGSRCWQDYKQLKKTRDRIVHMKSGDRKSSGPEVDTIWKAVFLCPAPHLAAKTVIDFFAKNMQIKPGWHSRFPHIKT